MGIVGKILRWLSPEPSPPRPYPKASVQFYTTSEGRKLPAGPETAGSDGTSVDETP